MRTMKVVLLSALGLSSAASISAQTIDSVSSVEKQVTTTLHQMYEAEKHRDLKFVLSHLADDFAEVSGDGGIYHRSDIEAGWADIELRNYDLSDCVFKLMTPDAAYLSCKMGVDATYKGQPFPQRFRVTTIWTRLKDQWLIRFEQGTVIPEPKENTMRQNRTGTARIEHNV